MCKRIIHPLFDCNLSHNYMQTQVFTMAYFVENRYNKWRVA